MITLALEAATYAGSVAVIDGSAVRAERTVAMRGREHEALMPAVAAVLGDAGIGMGDVVRVACGAGPGAFTSLRIAGGIAKGLALAGGIPLVAVSSLALIVAAAPLAAGRYLAVLDAMRGQSYAATFVVDDEMAIAGDGPVRIIESRELAAEAGRLDARLVGPAIGESGGIGPHARGFARLANMTDAARPADLAGWEPAYGRLAEAQVQWEAQHGRPLLPT